MVKTLSQEQKWDHCAGSGRMQIASEVPIV